MKRRLCSRLRLLQRKSKLQHLLLLAIPVLLLVAAPKAVAGDEAPAWMHALVSVPLPLHDDEAEAVLLYSEKDVIVQSANSLRIVERKAYKILRPGGRSYGDVVVDMGPRKKITGMRGWCIPGDGGKDFQIKDKEAVETSPDSGGELFRDIKLRIIRIPAANPGNIVGFEYQTEEQPFILQDTWDFQLKIPVRAAHYTLELPSGWTYVARWANYPETKPSQAGNNRWQWALSGVKEIRHEEDMPALRGVAGQMVVYFVPPGETAANAYTSWKEVGDWYRGLTAGRIDPSPELKQTATQLTSPSAPMLAKMQAIAKYVQETRYVAIELGIGGWQPHPAASVFSHRYGDCKDKSTLAIAMFREIGLDAYYVVVNSHRGAVTPDTPPNVFAFNHVIVAIPLPDSVKDRSLVAILSHPKYGRLLIFDPTYELMPFGQIGSYLQGGYGLLVLPDGGELVQLPTQPPSSNSLQRIAMLTLDSTGTLKGSVNEVRLGDKAAAERERLHGITKEADQIKPIENILSGSLTNFKITQASILNLHKNDQFFGFDYSFEAPHYAKNAGGLILLRPRVLGVKAIAIPKDKQARQYPFQFRGVGLETDSFDITIPAGYAVDDLPEAVNAEYSFGSYQSSTVVDGSTIHYRRRYEIKQLTVPVEEADKLRNFYGRIASDERNMVVLKPSAK